LLEIITQLELPGDNPIKSRQFFALGMKIFGKENGIAVIEAEICWWNGRFVRPERKRGKAGFLRTLVE